MVPQGDLVQTPLLQCAVQRSPAHFGTHGAGILLPAHIKNDVVDLTLQQSKGDIQVPAQPGHRRKVHPRPSIGVSHVQGECLHLEGNGIKFPQLGQGHQQHQRVLAAGDAHGDAVVGCDHLIVLHTAADQGKNTVHFTSSQGKKLRFPEHFQRLKLKIEIEKIRDMV